MDDTALKMMQLAHQGYSCAQILLKLALELRREDNPGLIRALAGLADGCSQGRATCGALTGGCCLIAYLAAANHPHMPLMTAELTGWFSERFCKTHGSLACGALTGGQPPQHVRRQCGQMVYEVYCQVLDILASHAVDPLDGA